MPDAGAENRPVLPDPGAALKKRLFVTVDGRNGVVTFLLFFKCNSSRCQP